MRSNPILAEVTRGGIVESRHRGIVAIMNPKGELVGEWGDSNMACFPRSAMKPFQAMSSLETGAFDAFQLTPRELALHCSSHSGEPAHVRLVDEWLKKIGLDEQALDCGCQTPFWVMHDWSRVKESPVPSPLCNNCSGKHAGFLTAAMHLTGNSQNYLSCEHVVQQNVMGLLAQLSAVPAGEFTIGIDGCSAPVYALPIRSFANALAKLASPAGLGEARTQAARQVIAAMRQYPWLVAGTGRLDTLLMQESEFTGIAKCGAEGFYGMALPEQELGIAIKIEDGADRAAGVVAIAVLHRLGILSDAALQRLHAVARPAIHNWQKKVVGEIRATL